MYLLWCMWVERSSFVRCTINSSRSRFVNFNNYAFNIYVSTLKMTDPLN